MSIPIFAVEIDNDWLKLLGAVLSAGFVTALSYAIVRVWKAKGSEGRANVDTDMKRRAAEEEIQARKDGLVWDRVQALINGQESRIVEQDRRIGELLGEVGKYRVEAASATTSHNECQKRERELSRRIKVLEQRLEITDTGPGSGVNLGDMP